MRRGSIAFLAVALLVLGGTGAVYAYDSSRDDLIAEGVRVGGVDVGGLRAAEARRVLSKRIDTALGRPLTVRHRDRTFGLRPSRIGARADLEAMVDEAVDRSRAGGPVRRTLRGLSGGRVEARVAPRISFDQDALQRFVGQVKRRVDRPAHDATVKASGSGIATVRHRTGAALNARSLEASLASALRSVGGTRDVDAPVRVTRPRVTVGQLAERHPHYITVDRQAFRLHHYRGLRRVKTYVIAVGRVGFETPEGLYHVQNKAVDPVWHVPNKPWAGKLAGRVIPPGPDNPIKSRWMGISDGAGIHGTDETASLGSAASHGCIRMSIPEVKELYDQIPVGTPIYIG